MNREHPWNANDPLGDEIERALAVDPSPDFVRRVRRRINEEPPSVAWLPWRWVGGFLVAAGGVALYFAWLAADLPVPHAPAQMATAGRTRSGDPPRTPPPPDASAPSTAQEVRANRLSETPVTVPSGPVGSPEAEGLRALMRVRSARIDASEWPRDAQPSERGRIDDIVIPPIDIEPLSRLALLSGEPQ